MIPWHRRTRLAVWAGRSRSTTRWASLADYLFSGKLIQFPKLKLADPGGSDRLDPYAVERADTVWEHHDAWQHSKELIPEPPSTYYYGRIFGCFTADRVGLGEPRPRRPGQHLLRDRLPAHRHDVAGVEAVRRGDGRGLRARRGDHLQGAARQRHPDARTRSGLTRSGRRRQNEHGQGNHDTGAARGPVLHRRRVGRSPRPTRPST